MDNLYRLDGRVPLGKAIPFGREPPMTEVTGFLIRHSPQAALGSRTWSPGSQPISSAQIPHGYSLPRKWYLPAGLPVSTLHLLLSSLLTAL